MYGKADRRFNLRHIHYISFNSKCKHFMKIFVKKSPRQSSRKFQAHILRSFYQKRGCRNNNFCRPNARRLCRAPPMTYKAHRRSGWAHMQSQVTVLPSAMRILNRRSACIRSFRMTDIRRYLQNFCSYINRENFPSPFLLLRVATLILRAVCADLPAYCHM